MDEVSEFVHCLWVYGFTGSRVDEFKGLRVVDMSDVVAD